MKNVYAGGYDESDMYEQHVQNVYQQMPDKNLYQQAYTVASDKWQETVEFVGGQFGYGWLLFAALIGMPITVVYLIKKIAKVIKS